MDKYAEIRYQAFHNELEKNAFFATAAKWGMHLFSKARLALKGTQAYAQGAKAAFGNKQGLEYMARYANPRHMLFKKPISAKNFSVGGGQPYTFGSRILGDLAQNARTFSKGVRGKGVFGGTNQVLRNTGTWAKAHLRGSQYKTIDPKKMITRTDLKTKNIYAKRRGRFSLGERQVLRSDSGNLVVKKRLGIRPAAAAFSVPGFMAMGAATGVPDSQGKSNRLKGAAEGALWMSPMLAASAIGVSVFKDQKRKKKLMSRNATTTNYR